MANPKAAIYREDGKIDHTPGSAVTGGAPTEVISDVLGIPQSDIAAGATDAIDMDGVIVKIEATAAVGNVGDNVWWDADGSPYGGTATSGAATTIASAGDQWIGTLAKAHAATDTHAYVRWNKANPKLPAWPDRVHETKSANYTIDAQDAGKVIHVDTDAVVITLPATSVGIDVIIQNDAADGTALISISPNASDKIMGPDVAGEDNKDQQNTKLTQIRGDYEHIVSDGANGWYIVGRRGTWAQE